MASINRKKSGIRGKLTTHEGGRAKSITPDQQLVRMVNATMLWEDQFYVDGVSIADAISTQVPLVKPETVRTIAIKARTEQKLRHVPLLLARAMAKLPTHKHLVADTLEQVIQRPDEIAEYLSIYWKNGKQSISAQSKKGLAAAFQKFNEYELSKYKKDQSNISLRDVLFLVHPKAKNKSQYELFKKLAEGTLEVPDTWEVALSGGADKKETFTRLLSERKLGALALLRNLRNMQQAGVDMDLIKDALENMKVERVLPFRFISAARHAPVLEPQLEQAMFKAVADHEKLGGKTILLVDVSGSMSINVSGKSEISRLDAACGLAILLREICDDVEVYTFSDQVAVVPARRGFALRDAIDKSQLHNGTYLGQAVSKIATKEMDRFIVITDEQSHDNVPVIMNVDSYMINVASYKNGVGYGLGWNHIDGWSESVVQYIQMLEKEEEYLED